ncbi:hypothetical protein [Niallia sp. MER 6]|uniref:hypothetical protein n=1 Tax=Niallia sp. MER 6 TaxID=2939567 RepID=UPI00203BC3DD|nr:hypothetical protein [Niallia sp. MER 6]MCM3032529.1 hypothetical protein [Niallia sp. MER 6]
MSKNNKEYYIMEKELKEINKGILLFLLLIFITILGMTLFSGEGYHATKIMLPFIGWVLIILSTYALVIMLIKRYKIKVEMNKMLNGD